MKQEVHYLPDRRVDEGLDRDIRTLLTTCFTKPESAMFRDRRYYVEPYPHRWVIRDSDGVLAAHVGVHQKHVLSAGRCIPIGGICEVCVRPDHQGRGYVRTLLGIIHAWLAQRDFVYAVLFGDPRVYGSSGYVSVGNLTHENEKGEWKPVAAMVHELTEIPWPAGEVRLPGPIF